MKSILLTTSTLPRFQGDPEPRFVLDLAFALSRYYRVTILAPSDALAALSEKIGEVEIVRYRYAPLRRWETLAYPGAILPRLKKKPWLWPLVPLLCVGLHVALSKLLKSRQFDLVHCHWFVPQGAVQAWGFFHTRAPPFIVTSHGGDLNTLKGRFIKRALQYIMGRAAAVTVVSRQLQKRVAKAGYNSRVIPMGVDARRFCVTTPVSLAPGDKTILFVGRLAEKKGVNILIEAMARPELRHLGCRLLVVGDGPDKGDLMNLADSLSVASSVNFLGAIGHEDLPEVYSKAHIFCAPSIVAKDGDMDGLPTVILEASAAGKPCVSTRVGGISDFIENDVNGCLVEPGDSGALAHSLARLLDDDEFYHQLSSEARKRAAQYDWPIIARRFSALYEQYFNPPPGFSQDSS
ncbi:MAG: glycosyltransferase family 4 protein [Proteobacteria bacterium]|nr:glycosyltransferase family 4 protein [Pseudomonadota bacterium]